MAQYDRYVIGKLLDTYESSLLSTGENRRNIHIEFRFTKKGVPAYFDESSGEYEKIHLFMEDLLEGSAQRAYYHESTAEYGQAEGGICLCKPHTQK